MEEEEVYCSPYRLLSDNLYCDLHWLMLPTVPCSPVHTVSSHLNNICTHLYCHPVSCHPYSLHCYSHCLCCHTQSLVPPTITVATHRLLLPCPCCHPVSVATHAQSLLPPTVSAGTASRICCHPHRHLLSSERYTHTVFVGINTVMPFVVINTVLPFVVINTVLPFVVINTVLPFVVSLRSSTVSTSPTLSCAIHSNSLLFLVTCVLYCHPHCLLPSTLSTHTVSTVIHTVSPSTVSRHPQLLSKLSLLPSTLSLLPVTLSLMTPVYCHPYFLLPSTAMSVLQIIPYD